MYFCIQKVTPLVTIKNWEVKRSYRSFSLNIFVFSGAQSLQAGRKGVKGQMVQAPVGRAEER